MESASQRPHAAEPAGGFVRTVTASAEAADQFRREFSRWVDTIVAGVERRTDIVLSVYEALANAVEHAYATHPTPDPVHIHASLTADGGLDVCVIDTGRWKPEQPSRFRGRGLPLMKALSDSSTVITGPGGTEVRLQWRQVGHAPTL